MTWMTPSPDARSDFRQPWRGSAGRLSPMTQTLHRFAVSAIDPDVVADLHVTDQQALQVEADRRPAPVAEVDQHQLAVPVGRHQVVGAGIAVAGQPREGVALGGQLVRRNAPVESEQLAIARRIWPSVVGAKVVFCAGLPQSAPGYRKTAGCSPVLLTPRRAVCRIQCRPAGCG